MATGLVEYVGTQIGSTGDSGHEYTKLIDNDPTTYMDVAGTANGIWAGLDLGSAATVRRIKFQPRRGDSGFSTKIQFEDRVFGGKVQASSSSTFSSDVNDALTLAASGPPSYRNKVWNEVDLTSPISKQYIRWLSPNGGHGNMAELRFIGDAGPSSAKPVAPRICDSAGNRRHGGRFPSGKAVVTLTCETTSASIYYTTDGTTPDNTKTLYAGMFTLDFTGGAVTLKAVAYDAGLGTTLSDVVQGIYNPWGFKPNEDWYDDRGDLVEAHSGGYLKTYRGAPMLVNGYYWWYGGNCNRYNVVEGTSDGLGVDGIWLYKTTDFLNFTFVGNVLDNAASSYTLRPHVLYNPKNGNYVLWAKTWATNNAAIATATNPAGPWTWQNTAYAPGGGFNDFNLCLFMDGTAYVVWDTTDNGSIKVQALAEDFQTVTGSSVTVSVAGNQEAPCLVQDHEGKAVLVHSSQSYYDSTITFNGGGFLASTPLGSWAAPATSEFKTNPVGGNYNAQPTDILVFPNGYLFVGDYWVHSDIYNSRYVCLPVEKYVEVPVSWDLSRFDIPANDLLRGLVYFYSCGEVAAGDDLVDKVGGLTLSRTGNMNVHGLTRRWRAFDLQSAFHADNAAYRTGDIQVWWNIWFSVNSIGGFPMLFSKWDASSDKEYVMYLDSSGHVVMELSANGSSTAVTVTSAVQSANTITMATFWHDSVLNEAGLCINGNLAGAVTSSYSSGIFAGGSIKFCLGREGNDTNNFNGQLKEHGMWKAAKPTQQQLNALWNNGNGLPWEYFQDGSIPYQPRVNKGQRPAPFKPGSPAMGRF